MTSIWVRVALPVVLLFVGLTGSVQASDSTYWVWLLACQLPACVIAVGTTVSWCRRMDLEDQRAEAGRPS